MRLIAFAVGLRVSWGLLEDDRIIDLGGRPELDGVATLQAALHAHDLLAIAMYSVGLPPSWTIHDVQLLEALPSSDLAVADQNVAFVVGTSTASWQHARDPLEHIAGHVELTESGISGRPRVGSVLHTRDDWRWSATELAEARAEVVGVLTAAVLAPGTLVPMRAVRLD